MNSSFPTTNTDGIRRYPILPHAIRHRARVLQRSGSGGSPSEETRRKISEAKKGENNPMKLPEARQKVSEALKGRKRSEEHRHNVSEALKGENNPQYGRKLSEEHRHNVSEALKGKNAHPLRQIAHQFFLSLSASLSKTEKNKRLYDQFPNIPRYSIQRWTRRWQAELDNPSECPPNLRRTHAECLN